MDTPRDRTVRRFVRWLKDKVENRRGRDGDNDPWWVTLLLDVGRPVVAVMILTMCAPGEHYLAVQAGWSERLAWGMPGTLTAYAGIAAVVATKRPKSAPGRKTAVTGAVVSVGLAMAAQPVAHLYGKTGLTSQLIWLTVIMGVVPAAVFGHLLHMGAGHGQDTPAVRTKPGRGTAPRTAPVPAAVPRRTAQAPGTASPAAAPGVSPGTAPVPAGASQGTASPAVSHRVSLVKSPVPAGVPVDELSRLRSLTDVVRALRAAGHDRDTIKAVVPTVPGYEDVKDNSLNKALKRTA